MIAHSDNFKDAFTGLGRDLLVKINFYEKSYNLETENDKLILTQDNKRLLSEPIKQSEPIGQIDENDIISLKKNNLGELYHTYMKSFDLETTYNFSLGDKTIIQIGTTVNGIPEYLDYGTYIVYEKKYSEATKTYTYTLCDSMLLLMVEYDNDEIFGNNTQLTLENFIGTIKTKLFGLISQTSFDTNAMVNKNEVIYKETFAGIKLTYRDVLDMVMQASGCSLIATDRVILGNILTTFKCITLSDTVVDEIDGDIIRDDTATFKEKFGPINSLIFSRADGTDEIEAKDDSSITANGKTSYIIKDNLILQQTNRSNFLNTLFNRFKGIEYYTNDMNTVGVGYIEYLDRFDVRTEDNIYHCICLQNTGDISNGMNEKFKSPAPSQVGEKYVTTKGYDDKTASILMDKINGTIVLKTDNNGHIASVRLDSSYDDTSKISVDADEIDFTGKTLNLTSDNMSISSTNFSVTNAGVMTCSKANITGGEINMTSTDVNPTINISGDDTHLSIYGSGVSCYDENNYWFDIYVLGGGGGYPRGATLLLSDEFGEQIKLSANEMGLWCPDIYYENLYPQSSIEKKKNVEKFDKKALDIVKNTDIYEYNYKREDDTTKKHIGAIIGEDYNCSDEIISSNNEGIDIYSMTSILWKAVQEQQKEIEQLKKELKELKK